MKTTPKPRAKRAPTTLDTLKAETGRLRNELTQLTEKYVTLVRVGSEHEQRIKALIEMTKRDEKTAKRRLKTIRKLREQLAESAAVETEQRRQLRQLRDERIKSGSAVQLQKDFTESEQRVKHLRSELTHARDKHADEMKRAREEIALLRFNKDDLQAAFQLEVAAKEKLIDELAQARKGLDTLKVNPGDAVVPARVAVDLQSVGHELLKAQQTMKVQQAVIENRDRRIKQLEEVKQAMIDGADQMDTKCRFNRRIAEILFLKLETAEEELDARQTEINNLQAVLKNNA